MRQGKRAGGGTFQQPKSPFDNPRLSAKLGAVDLDLGQARAFAAIAQHLHFGRGAQELGITQQALSKRLARLEEALGTPLVVRDGRIVELTEAGRRFLEPARAAIAAGDLAVRAVLGGGRPLRLDAWGHLYAPTRTLGRVLEHCASTFTAPEVGAARDLPAVANALLRGESDLGFGRVHALAPDWDAALTSRLVRLEPVDVLLGPNHPLADRDEVRPAELAESTLIFPAAVDRLEFLRSFAERFGPAVEGGGVNLGLDHLLHRVAALPGGFTLFPADAPVPEGSRIRSIPLVDPTPLYAWSLLWRSADRHPDLDALLAAFADVGRANRWLEYRPGADWLPDSPYSVA